MSRKADWEPALIAWLEACERRPFAWGDHDCCSFAANAVRMQTGADFYEPFAGTYSTQAGALKALRRHGHRDLFGPFDAALGERRAPLLLQRGDIVSDGTSVGVLWQQLGPVGLFVGELGGEDAGTPGLVALPASALKFGWNLDHG